MKLNVCHVQLKDLFIYIYFSDLFKSAIVPINIRWSDKEEEEKKNLHLYVFADTLADCQMIIEFSWCVNGILKHCLHAQMRHLKRVQQQRKYILNDG